MGDREEKRAARIAREIREAASEREAAKKTATARKSAAKRGEATAPEQAMAGLAWVPTKKDEQWNTSGIPTGDGCTARIVKSSRNEDGTHSYFCYRNARAVAITRDFEAAKAACARGTPAEGEDRVLTYVTNHPLDVPPFLALTLEERRAVRAQYPFAAPSEARVRVAAHKRGGAGALDPTDPGSAALLEELRTTEAAARPGRAAKVPGAGATRGPAPQGVLARVRDGNPKKPGSGAHGRWERLFVSCEKGMTVAEYERAGCNMDTLANAMKMGYVTVKRGEK